MNSLIPRPNTILFSRPSLRWLSILVVISMGLVMQKSASAAADAFDEALDRLVVDAVKAVEESGKKKIAVLDFPDIAGATSAFGKYLAEQVSVGMVTSKKGFTVVDRANLKSILAEHQLTEEGLIRPENAKQLGEFSGVDALVLGTITSVNSGHIITVKILATDKADIVGAAKAKLPLNQDFDAVLNTEVAGTGSKMKAVDQKKAEFSSDYFKATVKKTQILKSGEVLILLDFLKNKNESSVAAYLRGYQAENNYYPTDKAAAERADLKALMSMPTTLRSSNGDDYKLVQLQGMSIRSAQQSAYDGRPMVALSETQPTTVTLKFKLIDGAKISITPTTSFTLDSNVGIATRATNSSGFYQDVGVVDIHIEGIR